MEKSKGKDSNGRGKTDHVGTITEAINPNSGVKQRFREDFQIKHLKAET